MYPQTSDGPPTSTLETLFPRLFQAEGAPTASSIAMTGRQTTNIETPTTHDTTDAGIWCHG